MASPLREAGASRADGLWGMAAGESSPKDGGHCGWKGLPRALFGSPVALGRKCIMLSTVPSPGCCRRCVSPYPGLVMSAAFLQAVCPRAPCLVFTFLRAWGWVFEPHQPVGVRRG